MVGFARAHGIDAVRCVAINEVLTDGTIHNDSARLWPQTERLKAALTRLRRTGDPAERDEAVNAYGALKFYWATPVKGDGTWVEEPAPGSSLYHITCALAELIDTTAGREVKDG